MKALLTLFTVSFLVIQLSLTMLNKHIWPFCAYSMFNRVPSEVMVRPKLDLILNNNKMVTVDVHETLPLEFFRAMGIYYTVYDELNELRKKQFSKLILKTLNESSWNGFDEVYKSYRAPGGKKVKGFSLVDYKIDFRSRDREVRVYRGDVLYSFEDRNE